MSRDIRDYIDKHGLIVQSNGDGGDTFHRMNMYAVGLKKREELGISNKGLPKIDLEEALNKLECQKWKGNYVRHPNPNSWTSHCDRLSRDQAIPFIYATGKMSLMSKLIPFLIWNIIRLGFMTNTRNNHSMPGDSNYKWKIPDWNGPRIWAMYIRSLLPILILAGLVIGLFNIVLLSKLVVIVVGILLLGDLHNLFNSLVKVLIYDENEVNSDDLNHILVLMQAKEILPTPIGWLARKIYVKYRESPKAPDGGYKSDFAPQKCLDHYFREDNGGPPMDDVFRPILEKSLK